MKALSSALATRRRALVDARRQVRSSLLWMLLARQRKWVRWVPFLLVGGFFSLFLVTNATVAMIDSAVVAQAVPLEDYVGYIVLLAAVGFVIGRASPTVLARIGRKSVV